MIVVLLIMTLLYKLEYNETNVVKIQAKNCFKERLPFVQRGQSFCVCKP
jgi:hypothetical protein